MDTSSSVVVAVASYRRPVLLERALRALLDQTVPGWTVELLVVDNDPEGSARAVVSTFGEGRIAYVHEPRPGLAAARNAALDAAREFRLLAFFDDDEQPGQHWLSLLVQAWERYGCDAVVAPTFKELPAGTEAWVRASGFFDHTPRITGQQVAGAASGNLLLDLESLRRRDLRFDEAFGLTGGEDTMLSRRLTSSGGVIRVCEEAAVVEPVSAERAKRSWVLRREVRTASTWSRVHLALEPSWTGRMRTAVSLGAHALVLVVRGALLVAAGRLRRSLARTARGERQVARGWGMARGLAGVRVEEYGRTAAP